jgi:hypothetical protein
MAVVLALFPGGAAARAAVLAPGLTRSDFKSILTMAGTHWPHGCQGVMLYRAPASVMRGRRIAPAAGRRCTILIRRGTKLTATGWCRALQPVFARLAGAAPPSSWPYDCSLAVGPTPAKAKLVGVPGLTPDQVTAAYKVASAHWPASRCRGHEQMRWGSPEQLALGLAEEPQPGLITLGEAIRGDQRCTIWLNEAVTEWTPYDLCLVSEHEFGHLAGLGHSTSGVMAPVNAHSPDCESAFPVAPGATAPTS